MAFGGDAPAQQIKYWSQVLDESRDLAEHYTSEESIRDELQKHYINQESVRDMAETHIAAALVLWHRARRGVRRSWIATLCNWRQITTLNVARQPRPVR